MNIYERLTQDHDQHREWAAAIADTSGDSPERRRLWDAFRPDCEAHANAEEQTFYAALIEKPDGQEKSRHSISEHKELAELIEELSELEMSSGGWLQKFKKLKDQLEHHMEEEEEEIFQLAKTIFNEDRAKQLTKDFEDRKANEM